MCAEQLLQEMVLRLGRALLDLLSLLSSLIRVFVVCLDVRRAAAARNGSTSWPRVLLASYETSSPIRVICHLFLADVCRAAAARDGPSPWPRATEETTLLLLIYSVRPLLRPLLLFV